MEKIINFITFVIACLILVTGCSATRYAFTKVRPSQSFQDYGTIFLSNGIYSFNFKVYFDDGRKEEIWCATLPYKYVDEYSHELGITLDQYLRRKYVEFNKDITPLPVSLYTIEHSPCNETHGVKVPIQYMDSDLLWAIYISGEKFSSSTPAKYVFEYTKRNIDENGMGFLVYKSNENSKNLRISKLQTPIPQVSYSYTRLACLPLLLGFDVVTLPIQLFVGFHGM